jgi:hypothetical protein
MKKKTYDLSLQRKPKSSATNLTFEGEVVAEIPLGVNPDSILDQVRDFLSGLEWDKKATITIKNDDDKLGVIVDYYIGDDCEDSETIWFDDYMIETED